MLGLLKRPSGHDNSSFKAGKSVNMSGRTTSASYANTNGASAAAPAQIVQNGNSAQQVFSPPASVAQTATVTKQGGASTRRSVMYQQTHQSMNNTDSVKEQYTTSRAHAHQALGSGVGGYVFDTSYTGLLEWIRNERLTKLPHKGGSWDRVLISAQYFAEQVNRFSLAISGVTAESTAASHLVYGQCLLILELGSDNAQALETVFTLFYQFGVVLSPLLRRAEIFTSSSSIAENIGKAFSELVGIVSGVAITFYQIVHSQSRSTSIDIFSTFHSSIESFRYRVALCSQEIWNFALQSHGINDIQSLEVLQTWLAPQDTIIAFLASNSVSLASLPEQFTCTWLQGRLNSFLQSPDRVLVVEGKPGTGKTTLANWTVDRLQRPIGRKLVSTLNFSFNSIIPAQNTPLAMLKTLMWQLVSQRIGDIHLYKTLSDAYQELKHVSTPEQQEQGLWSWFDKALHAISEDETEITTIIVDGLDEVSGSKAQAQEIVKKLHFLAQEIPVIRVIQFSQPLDVTPASSVRISLTVDNIFDDIRTVVRRGLYNYNHFIDQDEAEQDLIVEQLALAADTSILWAFLATKTLRLQTTHGAFTQTLQTLLSSPKTVPDVVEKLLNASYLTPESKTLLSLLTAAQRPLLLSEVQPLLQANPDKFVLENKSIKMPDVVKSIAPLVITGEGLISLRHPLIRDSLQSLPTTSKASLSIKDPNRDFVVRLLINVHSTLRGDQEPTFNFLDMTEVLQPLHSHKLLEYTVRYWITHFKRSSLFKPTDTFDLPKEFQTIFPATVTFPLLEETCWRSQVFPSENVEYNSIAYRVRKSIFGQDHPSVLQTAITLAFAYEVSLDKPQDAIKWYTTVFKTGTKLFGANSDVVIHSCTTILRLTETSVTTSRTEIMSFREEVLKILVTAYTTRYGSSSKEVTAIYQKLTDHYVATGETEKTKEIQKTETTTDTHVHTGHSDGVAVSRSIDVTLNKHKHKEYVHTLDSLFHGYQEHVEESFTLAVVEKLLLRITELIKQEEYEKAEEVYIELWWKLTEHCHTVRTLEWHEKKLDLMIAYAKFLQSRKRTDEASSVLISAWREFEHNEFSMYESIIVRLREVAVVMKSVGLTSVALAVYQRCWSYFKNTHRDNTSIYKSIEEDISICSRELVKSSTSNKVTSSSETVMREVFEHSITSTTEVSTNTVELARSLTSVYMEQSRYSQATSILETTLKKTWASFFSESIDSISVTNKFSSESIELVQKLAECYISQKRFDKAEELYVRLYRVHRKVHGVDNAAVIKYRDIYLTFLKKHEMYNRVINFYQELLVEYRAFYGPSHKQTITILYALADTCRHYHLTHGYWIEYYLEIVNVINKGELVSHEDALRAVIIIAEHYYETERYTDSLIYFKSVAATFIKHGKTYKYFEHTTEVQKFFDKYYRAIDLTKLDIHEHIRILKQLREACMKHYEESSVIAVHTTTILAETCAKNEAYEHEAIEYYEHVSRHQSSASAEVIKRTQTMLKTLYVKQITSSKASKSMSKEMTEKASSMLYERYAENRRNYSCTHESTLTALKELLTVYHKQSRTDLITKEIDSIVVESVTKVHSTKDLIYTAEWLASTCTTYTSREQALQIVRELKLQVIYKSVLKNSSFNVTTATRHCFAFIAAFEYHVRGDYTLSIAHYMAELVAEYTFYQRFVQCIKTKAKLQQVFVHGARLRHILYRNNRPEDFPLIESQLVDYFAQVESAVAKSTSRPAMQIFVSVVLRYVSEHPNVHFKNFVIAASYASVTHLRLLLKENREREALDLATCTYRYLMAHEGLDDPTEITLGFQLCKMTAGHGEFAYKSTDPNLKKGMMALSQQILGEVFDICKNNKINIAQAKLLELNELISLIGDHKDYIRLRGLLQTLWISREGQTSWKQDTILDIGQRLVQAEFSAGRHTAAIRLCEDIVYNMRRVHGARHPRTLSFYNLLAELYTSCGQHIQTESGKQDATAKKRSEQIAAMYFKKAVGVHEEVLKLLVDDGMDNSGDEDDLESEIGAADSVSANGFSPRRVTNGHSSESNGFNSSFQNREEELQEVRKQLKLLKLSTQRYGGFTKSKNDFERLTSKVHQSYGNELKLKDTDFSAGKWKTDGFGSGASESTTNEGAFFVPSSWNVTVV